MHADLTQIDTQTGLPIDNNIKTFNSQIRSLDNALVGESFQAIKFGYKIRKDNLEFGRDLYREKQHISMTELIKINPNHPLVKIYLSKSGNIEKQDELKQIIQTEHSNN
ncbi:MAG: hypothetical protein IAB19_02155 [Proteobacteria bacterium]|uniref:Uncharacterized protein n=1 Tax=Candidatus Avisuccinivibrio stercorigallinarum TaxID=2840704 RepID=A0A9D9DB25_9GAMM|nr:hypothetical protein [Candidatus Avisuccinivibrio stercorigallinarum]